MYKYLSDSSLNQRSLSCLGTAALPRYLYLLLKKKTLSSICISEDRKFPIHFAHSCEQLRQSLIDHDREISKGYKDFYFSHSGVCFTVKD